MTPIDFFKLQAKNLFKDYKTKTPYVDNVEGHTYYNYDPEFYDIDRILLEYDYDKETFSLMNAQHIIALMVGFRKWTDLLKASEVELELAKLLLDNQHKISIDDWEMYIDGAEHDNNKTFDTEARLEIFKEVFVKVEGHHNPFGDYRFKKQMQKASV
jgi:hypothetical protein